MTAIVVKIAVRRRKKGANRYTDDGGQPNCEMAPGHGLQP